MQRQSVISVRDHGSGVPLKHCNICFAVLTAWADARDRQSGGVGLGLSITARAVRFHHGRSRRSQHTRGGLLVEIRLPIAEAD
jgi:signal transduction histidine kinase